MESGEQHQQTPDSGPDRFATTQWSMVLAAGDATNRDSQQALSELCQRYWYPIHVYVCRKVDDVEKAQDLTQTFFATLLDKNVVETADPERGKFRAFLLTVCKRFLANEWEAERAEKRGGAVSQLSLDFDGFDSRFAVPAADSMTAETAFERQWAVTLLSNVMEDLRSDYCNRGKEELFDALKGHLSGVRQEGGYERAGEQLKLSPGAIKVAIHRMRSRYRDLLRQHIAETVESPDDVDDEIRRLFEVLGARG